MKHTRRNAAVALVLLLAIVFGCMFAADRIQRGNGTIAVTEGWIETDVGNLMYKLYTPKTATAENPASGVLLLHGYQNDHETCAPCNQRPLDGHVVLVVGRREFLRHGH